MEREPGPALNPAALPPGTEVGPWRVVAWVGCGCHSAVYRAVRRDKPLSAAIALKVALLPRDPRFAREVELLFTLRHPSIPRLWDSGEWQLPGGAIHPYIAMDWVDGVPLYEWARQHAPSPERQLQVLAQLASALQALHARGGVHRDVKGDNVLVRRSDQRAILIDFGTGRPPDAPTLTPPGAWPGTPAYRSPERGLFELRSLRDASARHQTGPADDLYALGVTACRFVTGDYPEFGEPTQDAHGTWHMEAVLTPASLQHCEPRLRDLILRMLSVRPEQRGTAAQLAEALQRAARNAVSESAPPSRSEPSQAPQLSREEPTALPERPPQPGIAPARGSPRAHARHWRIWSLAIAASLPLAVGVWWAASGTSRAPSLLSHWAYNRAEQPDAGPTGLGEALASASMESSHEFCSPELLSEDTPPEPLPGQDVPDARGRCPHKQVALNGGCWTEAPFDREECEERSGYFFKKKCYLALIPRKRRPTSNPTSPQNRLPCSAGGGCSDAVRR